ncbi:MAG: AAA family ATPase [Elusimicrobia bacterium]|nr:AAA family ATPase [Elusimicrobiota bacterium]
MSNRKAISTASRILSAAVALVLAFSGPLSAAGNVAAVRIAPMPVTGASALAGARLYHVELPNLSLQGGSLNVPSASLTPSVNPTVASVAAPEAALPAAIPTLQAHPVFDVLNKLEAAGVNLQGGGTQADAAKLIAAAETLPAGRTRDDLVTFAKALSAPKGEVGAGLDKAYDNSAASNGSAAVAVESGSIWNTLSKVRLLPRSLRKSFAQRAEKGRLKAQPQDPAKFEVPVDQLRWVPAADLLPESTKDIPAGPASIVGQDRALKALSFGLRMPGERYNIFVSGHEGSGRETAVRSALAKLAPAMPTPRDMVAVTNFANPGAPALLKLTAGAAPVFQAAVAEFIERYKQTLPQLAQSEQLGQAKKMIEAKLKAAMAERQKALDEEISKVTLGKFGLSLSIKETEQGYSLMVAPTLNGKALTPEQVQAEIAAGRFTQAEWDEVMSKMDDAAAPFVEKFQAMMNENSADAARAEAMLGKLLQQMAGQLANQLGDSVRQAVVGGGNVDEGAVAEAKARFEAALAELQKEIAGVKVGKFGVILQAIPTEGGVKLGIGLTLDGEPVTPELLEAKGVSMDEVKAAQAELKKTVMPYVAKMKALYEKLNQELEAASSNTPAPAGPEDIGALNYVENLIGHAAARYEDFLPKQQSGNGLMAMLGGGAQETADPAENYKVNVIAANRPDSGAPVIFEKAPSFENLFGEVETESMVVPGVGVVKKKSPGGPTLRSGSFQRANGGFLVLNALDVLRSPGAWQGLMSAVSSGRAVIMEGGMTRMMGMGGEAYAMPTKVKVVLMGSPMIRMLLEANDESYAGNFNSKVEFQSTLDITKETINGVLGFLKKMVVSSAGQVLDMTKDAISAVMEYSARLAESNERLSAQFGALLGIMREASFWAKEAGRETVTREDVRVAVAAKLDREGGSRERIQEIFKKGVFRVDVQGAAVGQINGLAVMGDFGVPARITVVSSPGQAGLVSVDRDSGQTGPSFNKALGVVQGFLEHTFGRKKPVSAHLRISFEQNYGGIDGDSATSTEIYAILSSLSGVPIQQRFAVTGSADQFGNVQAIGGANHKIEGFYKVASGMVNKAYQDGLNAVLVPATNVKDLQLDEEVVKAVKEGRFKIYSVKHVSEGIEILTGEAYSEILRKAQARLDEFAEAATPSVYVKR